MALLSAGAFSPALSILPMTFTQQVYLFIFKTGLCKFLSKEMLLEISLIFASQVRRLAFIPGNFLSGHRLKMRNINFRCCRLF